VTFPLCGGCLCGAIRYECRAAPISAVFCHCRACQRFHAAPYAACALMPAGAIALVSGEPKRHTVLGASGAAVFREFCGQCGTHLFSGSEAFSQSKTVKIATLDDPAAVSPVVHVWVEEAISWDRGDDGLPRYPRQIEWADLERLWAEKGNGRRPSSR